MTLNMPGNPGFSHNSSTILTILYLNDDDDDDFNITNEVTET